MNPKSLLLPLAATAVGAPAFAQTVPLTVTAPLASSASAATVSTIAQTPPAPAGTATGGTPAAPSRPQPVAKPFATLGGFSFSGYLRSRVENFNFFDAANGDGSYTFTGHQLRLAAVKATPKLDLQFDLQQQLLTNLPDDAFFRPNATTAIPLGLGGNYYAANGSKNGALNVKQAFVRFKNVGATGNTARLGRFEFNEGTETALKDPTLNFLKTQRVSQRLIGTFGFTHTGRAFDGAQISAPVAGGNLTLVGARPTEGVFKLNANNNVDAVDFLYGAYTRPVKDGDARIFGLAYEDGRDAPKSVKVDNRPLAARQADSEDIRVYTLGANFLKTVNTKAGKFDALAWGALQTGKWGALDQSANAFTVEAGYQPQKIKLKPWLRLGYYRASGDGDATDGKHRTFFTPLPTPRLYARFPFYNQMNLEDLSGSLILRPTPKANLRFEAHSLNLTNSSDLLYAGGGAFQDTGFGFAGRPGGGSSKIANVYDVSLDYALDPKTSFGLYFARAQGGGVIRNTYANGQNANYAFVEFTRRF